MLKHFVIDNCWYICRSPTIVVPNSDLSKPAVLLPKRVDNGRHPDFSTSDEDNDDMGSPVSIFTILNRGPLLINIPGPF